MRRRRGSLEQEVLEVLAASAQPCSVSQVVAALAGAPAYTTVMTTLARLCEKGALTRTRVGRGFSYSLAAAPQSVAAAQTARQMHRLLAAEGRRDDVLARFVAELDPHDERVLLELLASQESPETGV